MGSLAGKTLFITGASRGIGEAIAIRAAQDGANIVIAAKTAEPHPKLEGTIYTAAEKVEKAGGKALPLVVDIRFEEQISGAMAKAAETFGGIDILVNNASAINLTDTASVDMKRFDLMHSINLRGTFLCGKLALPYLKKSANAHILNLSPPLNMEERWFAPHVAYTMAKFGMSMCILGWAGEFREAGIAANALWPKTTIATAAVQNLLGGDTVMQMSRWPSIMGDAAHWILTQPSRECTGNFFIDEEILLEKMGKKDLGEYSVVPGGKLAPDFFV
ncbi:MAG: NAD(P)-dependent oxidoreductase [Polyangiales bacterium]